MFSNIFLKNKYSSECVINTSKVTGINAGRVGMMFEASGPGNHLFISEEKREAGPVAKVMKDHKKNVEQRLAAFKAYNFRRHPGSRLYRRASVY